LTLANVGYDVRGESSKRLTFFTPDLGNGGGNPLFWPVARVSTALAKGYSQFGRTGGLGFIAVFGCFIPNIRRLINLS